MLRVRGNVRFKVLGLNVGIRVPGIRFGLPGGVGLGGLDLLTDFIPELYDCIGCVVWLRGFLHHPRSPDACCLGRKYSSVSAGRFGHEAFPLNCSQSLGFRV